MRREQAGRVLVTGATGFLGGAMVRHLSMRGVPVLAQGRDANRCRALERAGHPVLRWNIEHPYLDDLPDGAREVSAVVHCAALSAPTGPAAAFEAANVHGTRNVLDLAQMLGARRFVLVSSPSVCFAMRDQLGVTEDMPLPPPFNHYARTKRAAESLTLAEPQLGPVVLRPRGIYGPGDTALLPRLLRAVRRGPLPLLRDGGARIDLTYVADAISAIEAALTAGDDAEGEVFHISGGEVLPVTEIVERACERTMTRVRWRRLPLGPAMLAATLAETLGRVWRGEPTITRYGLALFAYAQSLDIGKAERVLGWTPRFRLEDGLARTFDERMAR